MSDPILATTGVTTGVQGAGASGAAPGDTAAAKRAQVQRLSQEFEAMLMTQMLRGMRRSMLSDDENEGGLGRETMTDTMDIELGRALASVGGFGLSSTLLKAIEKSVGVDDAEKSGQTVGAGWPGGSSGSDRVPSSAVPSGPYQLRLRLATRPV
jgi:Rod binding domain-containing protein